MEATPPPHPCGRTESCTLRILADAFTGAHKEKKRERKARARGVRGAQRPLRLECFLKAIVLGGLLWYDMDSFCFY